MRLVRMLQNRKWERHDYPFPYVYAQDVFVKDVYKEIEEQLQNVISRGVSEVSAKGTGKLSRAYPGYDAYGCGFGRSIQGAIAETFLSMEWHDLMASIFNVRGTGYISDGMHYHKIGSLSGYIHNDFNPVWFPITNEPGRLRFSNSDLCNYKTGKGPLRDSEKIQLVRGVVVIYYAGNGPWFPGDGGETGFYLSRNVNANTDAVVKIPPIDNSLVMYECTPRSFHAFITNYKVPRTTFIMWIHRPTEEAEELYGAQNLEFWGQND